MPKITAWIIPVTTLAILCTIMPAEPQTGFAPHPLSGTWELKRAEIARPDGTIGVDANYGPDARGLLIVDQTGRYSLQVFRPDRPKFASGDKARGTPEEYKFALLGLSTHTGRISVDTANHQLVFHIEHAAFPNWEHTDQRRAYQVSDEELSYQVPPGPSGTSAISVWRRLAGPR